MTDKAYNDAGNPYNAHILCFSQRLGGLRDAFYNKQTPVKETWKEHYRLGKFRKVKAGGSRHILFQGADGATIAYLVPFVCLKEIIDVEALSNMVENLPPISGSQTYHGVDRGLDDVRYYCIWNPYTKGLEPLESCHFKKDGKASVEFVKATEPLWNFAGNIMSDVFPSAYKLDTRYPLPNGMQRKAGPWMGMAINRGLKTSVRCKEHRDVMSAFYGFSCLCPLGKYTGGNLILWELQTEIELQPGDLFLFPDHLLTHSNSEIVSGVRHSLVAFMREFMVKWFEKTYKSKDNRVEGAKKRRESWRINEKRKKHCRLPKTTK